MKITKVVIKLSQDRNLLAFVNVVFDDCFIIRGVKIIQKPDGGHILAMPSRLTNAGIYRDVCHPLTADFRKHLENLILQRMDLFLKQHEPPRTPA